MTDPKQIAASLTKVLWIDLPACAKTDDERSRENLAEFAAAIQALPLG